MKLFKKFLCFALLGFTILSLFGCGSKNEVSDRMIELLSIDDGNELRESLGWAQDYVLAFDGSYAYAGYNRYLIDEIECNRIELYNYSSAFTYNDEKVITQEVTYIFGDKDYYNHSGDYNYHKIVNSFDEHIKNSGAKLLIDSPLDNLEKKYMDIYQEYETNDVHYVINYQKRKEDNIIYYVYIRKEILKDRKVF